MHDSPTGRRAVELAAPLSSETATKLILVAAYGSATASVPQDAESYQEPGSGPARLALKRAEEICAQLDAPDTETFAVAGDR